MKKYFKRYFLVISGICIVASHVVAFADNSNFTNGFNSGVQTATSLQGTASTALQNFKPETFVKNYTSNPNETNYVNNPNAIQNDAIQFRNTDPTGKSISQGIDDRKSQFNYTIDPNSAAIQAIQQRADDVYSVVTGQFGDCTKQTNCTTNYETHTCEESPQQQTQYCRKVLNVTMVPHTVVNHYPLSITLTTSDHNYAGVSVNVVTGNASFIGPHDTTFWMHGTVPSSSDCHTWQGSITSMQSNANMDYLNYPTCSSELNFHFTGSHTINVTMQLDIASTTTTYTQQDNWDDECTGLANTASCTFQEEHCVSPAATKDIQGFSVTRDCWEKQDSFLCGGGVTANACQPYRDQGCQQVSSTCENPSDGGCSLYQQTFSCPIKQCTDVGTICNGQTYCLSGDCVKQQRQADPDFQQGVAGLSAVDAAAKSYSANSGDQFSIFEGQVKTCNRDFLNFVDCCSDSGWGKDLHLAQCDQEAKDLGDAKQNGLTTYVDSDDECVLGICSHKKRYCVFPSKLARIIQQGGRHDQLHISFGTFDHPDCRGLTPTEFSSLNLNQINFSDFYADITQKESIEDPTHLTDRVSDKMTEWAKDNTPHG